MYKKGDFVFDKKSGLVKKVNRKGESAYSDAWLTDFGYVWASSIRPATPLEIENSKNQRVTVQILN